MDYSQQANLYHSQTGIVWTINDFSSYEWEMGNGLPVANPRYNIGLEAAFQVPMTGDSGSSPDAVRISNYCLTQEIFTPTPADCCPSINLKQCFGQ